VTFARAGLTDCLPVYIFNARRIAAVAAWGTLPIGKRFPPSWTAEETDADRCVVTLRGLTRRRSQMFALRGFSTLGGARPRKPAALVDPNLDLLALEDGGC
jgi:hypothetical protein